MAKKDGIRLTSKFNNEYDKMKAINTLEVKGISRDDNNALKKIDEELLELRRQKECWMFQNKWDQYEIQESINRLNNAYRYVYSYQTKDYSSYDKEQD